MHRNTTRSTRTALILTLAVLSLAVLATPAAGAVGGNFTLPLPNAPYLSFDYSDDISRTPASLNKTYVLTQVRNVVLAASGSTNTDAFSTFGPSTSCADPDINLAAGFDVARDSRFVVKVVYDQWDDATGTWLNGRELPLADIGRGDPGTIRVPICGDAVPNPL